MNKSERIKKEREKNYDSADVVKIEKLNKNMAFNDNGRLRPKRRFMKPVKKLEMRFGKQMKGMKNARIA